MNKHCWNCKFWKAPPARYKAGCVNECSQLIVFHGGAPYRRRCQGRKEARHKTASHWVCGFHEHSSAKMKQEEPLKFMLDDKNEWYLTTVAESGVDRAYLK